MRIVHTDRHRLHATDQVWYEGHPFHTWEVPARAEVLVSALRATRLGPVVGPADHGLEPILAVHDAEYVEFLTGAYEASAAAIGRPGPVFTETFATRHTGRRPTSFLGLKGYYAFGWGSPILEGTWTASYWSVQCALTAADSILSGDRAAYALCRPPGHHAGRDLYGGYCYLNNAAAAAQYLRGQGGRTAILDVDYHHGNGTQGIFYPDAGVLYASLHADPDYAYPYYWGRADECGEGEGLGCTFNLPLQPGTEDRTYLEALDRALALVRGFRPNWLVVSAGFDICKGDPEGGFAITPEGLREIGARIAALGVPAVVVQEGGYRLDSLGEDAVAFLGAFAV